MKPEQLAELITDYGDLIQWICHKAYNTNRGTKTNEAQLDRIVEMISKEVGAPIKSPFDDD